MARKGGIVGNLQEAFERRSGLRLEEAERVDLLEAQAIEGASLRRELDLLGWQVMDYFAGSGTQELDPNERRNMAQKSRVVWMQDPQAGAATDLLNDFVFGRGVPKPKAHDEEVQEVIDEAWDDPDNQIVLTSYAAQVALGVDLSLQSNIFMLMFDDGDDGKVKLGLLDHDAVQSVVRDPNNRLRVLFYVARDLKQEWDFQNDRPKPIPTTLQDGKPKVLYYDHWRNVRDAEEGEETIKKPPSTKRAKGRVYHVAVNRYSEQAFGVPTMRRTLRWYSAYNDFMKARVDMAQAAAAFIMRRKVKGTPNSVMKMASKAISRRSELATGPTVDEPELQVPPRPGSIITENENVSHESMNLNSNAGNASQDAQMLRSVISASTRFPQHYLGDAGSANLATATAMELPVLKAVEARQEVFEAVFRWFIDRVIERAVEAGRLDQYEDEAEGEEPENEAAGDEAPEESPAETSELSLSYEDKGEDENRTERDLGYEFSMPNPLRRMMTDLVSAVGNIAQTFDPNNTNVELSRILLNVVLGEALEVENPGDLVEKIFPEGYEDPAIAAAREQQQPPPPGGGQEEPEENGNPYHAKVKATAPEDVEEGLFDDLSREASVRGRLADLDRVWTEDVTGIVTDALTEVLHDEGKTPLGTAKRGNGNNGNGGAA